MINLLYVVSHPIQYQAPLLQRIAIHPNIRLTVLFLHYADCAFDPGFGRSVRWDIPLLDGYNHAVLNFSELGDHLSQADVVWLHGWHGIAMKRVLLAACRRGIPVLMRGENWLGAMPEAAGWRGASKRIYLRMIFSCCRAFLVIGSQNAAYYSRLGIPPERLFAMPYAVDNEFFGARATSESANQMRSSLGLPAERPIILFAGKLMRRKHPDTLLAAWRMAFPAQNRPLLVFVGDGEMSAELRHQAGEDVYFLGFRNQTELPALYAMADIFVLAAEREAWGLAINEAMACGTAVIASTECGAAYDLLDDNCGVMVEPGNVTGLADALQHILPRAREMGDAARRRVATWSFEADLTGLDQALSSVLSRGRN